MPWRVIELARWNPADHPRDNDGKFADVPGGGGVSTLTKSFEDMKPADIERMSDEEFSAWRRTLTGVELGKMFTPAYRDLDTAFRDRQREIMSKQAPEPAPAAPSKLTTEWSSAVKARLNKGERDALDKWQNGYYEDEDEETAQAGGAIGYYRAINAMARGHDVPGSPNEDDLAEMDEIVSKMEKALAKSRTSRDLVLYRGVTDLPRSVQVGDVLTDSAWVSTSYDPSVARGFADPAQNPEGGSGKNAMVMHIVVPKGTPALRVDDPVKHEIVLGPNTPMRVVRIEGKEIHLEVV